LSRKGDGILDLSTKGILEQVKDKIENRKALPLKF